MTRIESAIGGRRFTREQLKSVEARFAHGLGEYLNSPTAADVAPERKVAAKRDIDRAILADVALASGSAAGLAPVYRDAIAEWRGRIDSIAIATVMQALASEGLADWDSGKREWVGPGEGDPTGESEFSTERRWQRAHEAMREWFGSAEGFENMAANAEAAHDLTERKRRESEQKCMEFDKLAEIFSILAEAKRLKSSDD